MKREILLGSSLVVLAGLSALQAQVADTTRTELAYFAEPDTARTELAYFEEPDTARTELAYFAEPDTARTELAYFEEPDTARTELAFFDAPVKQDTVIKKNVRKFTAVDADKIPAAVTENVGKRYPEYTLVQSGKNEQQEYAMIINTKDGVKKTLIVKESGEILSDK